MADNRGMDLIRLIARPLLAAPFIAEGISALRNPEPHVEKAQELTPLLERFGIQPSDDDLKYATRALGGVCVGAGLMLSVGRMQRPSAGMLAITAIPLAFANNPVWKKTSRQARAEKRRSLMYRGAVFAGLVFAATDRRGKPSAAWKIGNWCATRSQLKEAKSQAWENARQAYQA